MHGELASVTADELVRRIYDAVKKIPDDALADELHLLLEEAFERWAPEADWADRVRYAIASLVRAV